MHSKECTSLFCLTTLQDDRIEKKTEFSKIGFLKTISNNTPNTSTKKSF